MPKRLTQREVEAILIDNGFEFRRQRGSHRIFAKPGHPRPVPIPEHGKSLAPGTLAAIIRESGLPKDLFR